MEKMLTLLNFFFGSIFIFKLHISRNTYKYLFCFFSLVMRKFDQNDILKDINYNKSRSRQLPLPKPYTTSNDE